MLGEIFYWLFNMSVAASICGVLILPWRHIRRIPRRVSVLLWLIPFIRLAVPVGITGKYGLMTLLSKVTTRSVTVYAPADDAALTLMNHVMAANSYFPITYKVDILADVFAVAAVIWAIVALALLLAFGIIYRTTMRELKGALPRADGTYRSDRVRVPAVYGIFRPRIVLPMDWPGDATYVRMHEEAHLRRGDHVTRLLAGALVCLHWFNPLAWLFLKRLYADMELACDEAVLARSTPEERKEYARTLLTAAEATTVLVPSFGGAGIRLRLESILSYKKISAVALVCSVLLLLVIGYVLLTNAA